MSSKQIVRFEVFGKVQGVFFRKFTQKKAKELGITGWVKNTEKGTVVGEMCGSPSRINSMKEWLQKTGSPKSKIQKCDFNDAPDRSSTKEFKGFDIVE